jgi:carboxymethylenebutenolidase
MIGRPAVLAGLGLLAVCPVEKAGTPQQLSVNPGHGDRVLTRYASDRTGKRPSVVLLPGTRGFEAKPRAYERDAVALSGAGIDAYFLHYLTAADAAVLTSKTSTRETREAYDVARFDGWAQAVSAAANTILDREGQATG